MNYFESYENFCRGFKGSNEETDRANIILFVQNWIVRISDLIDDAVDYNLDQLLIDNEDKSYLRYAKVDALSRILDDTFNAFVHISNNMREDIVRENVMMPVHKVREVNSHGLNWLSRRPGSTIKEKISGTNSMMAVKRRMSIDTGENRLFVAFLKELSDLLLVKIDNFPKRELRQEEEDYYDQIFSFLRNRDLCEVRRWENMPPNNTLLSDQNYKKIWAGWNELKEIDELISKDNTNLGHRLCQLYYVEFLTRACKFFRFPQVPVSVNYENYDVCIHTEVFYAVDNLGNTLRVEKGKNQIDVFYKEEHMNLEFRDDTLIIHLRETKEIKYTLRTESIFKLVEVAFTKLRCNKLPKNQPKIEQKVVKGNSVVMDIFKVRPTFKVDAGNIQKISGRILQQIHSVKVLEDEKIFHLPADKSTALMMTDSVKTYSVSSAINDLSFKHIGQMGRLMHMMEKYVVANSMTFVFPDVYNEFQLSLIHKAARMAYKEVKAFPRSIGIAFAYENSLNFKKQFDEDEFLLVVDLVDDDISFSLIQGIVVNELKSSIPEYGGIVWERHPSISESCDEFIDDIKDSLYKDGCIKKDDVYNIFGISGIKDEVNELSLIFDEEHNYSFTPKVLQTIKDKKILISDKVTKFIIAHKEIIGDSKVHIISLSKNLIYKGMCSFEYMDSDDALEGYDLYCNLQKKTSITLWRDHLPQLAIKLLYGKFGLVDNETVTPEFNVLKHIDIPERFTLLKDAKEYHFNLVQSDRSRKTRFMAVVKNRAFPLKHDVECRLDMTYKYGAENPYQLFFRPIDNKAGFVEAKVIWERLIEYKYKNMGYPEAITSLHWKDMVSYRGKDGTIDLIDELTKKLYDIRKGYKTIDTSQFPVVLKGEFGKRSFSLEITMDNCPVNIIFIETNVEKTNNGYSMNFDHMGIISFEMNEDRVSRKRYTADISSCARYGSIWMKKERGHACYPFLDIDGEMKKVAFFESEFDHPEDFYPEISNVSFEIVPYNDIYKAKKIHNEDSDEPYVDRKSYFAVRIRKGTKPGHVMYNGWMYFLMLTMFLGKNSFYDLECPSQLREAFEYAKESWLDMYRNCGDDYVKMRIFNLLSLVAHDIGNEYYEIAVRYIDDYLNGAGKLPDYIGYALGDCTTDNQKELLAKLYGLQDNKMVCILSKSIWGNEDFIKNVPVYKTLKYFEAAIDYLCVLCKDKDSSFKHKKNGKDITMCLEYILGVFRLRKYNDDNIDHKLSLNNPKVQNLYGYIEKIIENNIDIRSFLRLEVADKGIYEDIPDLLYAMLVYITGQQGGGEIRISGISIDDIDV